MAEKAPLATLGYGTINFWSFLFILSGALMTNHDAVAGAIIIFAGAFVGVVGFAIKAYFIVNGLSVAMLSEHQPPNAPPIL